MISEDSIVNVSKLDMQKSVHLSLSVDRYLIIKMLLAREHAVQLILIAINDQFRR